MGSFLSPWMRRNTGPPLLWVLWGLMLLFPLPSAGENPCGTCHSQIVEAYRTTPHAQLVLADGRFCQACHGSSEEHVESGELAGIRRGAEINQWSGSQQASACLSCHGASLAGYTSSPHGAGGVCWSCHSAEALHNTQPGPEKRQIAQCSSCHPQIAAQFRQAYHHPVPEQLMQCTSCHDVHGNRPLEVNAAGSCASCHSGQSGPFLFSHPALWEGCETCHTPHGSPHRGLLRTRGNGLCLACHTQSNFPGVGKANHDFFLGGGGRCWDCHSQVHGSNTTPDFNPRGRR